MIGRSCHAQLLSVSLPWLSRICVVSCSPMPRPPVRIVAFDLAGTLLRGHTVCEAVNRLDLV